MEATLEETEETFRLEVFEGQTTEIPERFLSFLGIAEGDEIRITTDSGSVKSVVGVHREESALVEEDDDVIQRRREGFRRGEHDSSERLERELARPRVSNAAG